MSFHSGAVSFTRFRVIGGSPKRLDDNLIDKLREHVIGRQRVRRSDDVDVGWIGGRHVLDRDFDVDKNVVGDCLHFGLRMDSNRVPPELARAYVEMEFDALTERAPAGRHAGRFLRQAREAARRRVEQEAGDGRYRRLRQFPILWDTPHDVLYAGTAQPAMLEHLHPLFKETFGRRLEPLTAGTMAAGLAERRNMGRSLESLEPARFVKHPSGNGHVAVWWTAHDPQCRDFLGNEFLLWLWYALAEESDTFTLADKSDAAVILVKRLSLECPWAENGKDTFLSDSPARLPEARQALAAGKLPRKAGMIVSRRDEQYELVLSAEMFTVSSATLPRHEHNGNGIGNVRLRIADESVEDAAPADPVAADAEPVSGNGNGHANGSHRARLETRIDQIRSLCDTVDQLFDVFLGRRLSSDWPAELNRITQWLRSK